MRELDAQAGRRAGYRAIAGITTFSACGSPLREAAKESESAAGTALCSLFVRL